MTTPHRNVPGPSGHCPSRGACRRRIRHFLFLGLAMLVLAGCSDGSGFINPAGAIAGDERDLFLWTLGLTLVVIVPVIIFTPLLIWRYRRNNSRADYRPEWESSRLLEVLAWGVPILIVTILSFMLWKNAYRLDPYRPLPGAEAPLKIEVVALDWKWLFIYPDQHVASVNELAIPVGRPISLTLTSATVMQSLLIPRLAGQIYAMAGMRTRLHLQADRAGTFTGENTQYNGTGFAKQKFQTLALPSIQFTDWIKHAKQSTQKLDCTSFTQLSKRDVPDDPTFYQDVDADLFDQIVSAFHDKPSFSCTPPTAGNGRG